VPRRLPREIRAARSDRAGLPATNRPAHLPPVIDGSEGFERIQVVLSRLIDHAKLPERGCIGINNDLAEPAREARCSPFSPQTTNRNSALCGLLIGLDREIAWPLKLGSGRRPRQKKGSSSIWLQMGCPDACTILQALPHPRDVILSVAAGVTHVCHTVGRRPKDL
jgi:hypothetical protein